MHLQHYFLIILFEREFEQRIKSANQLNGKYF